MLEGNLLEAPQANRLERVVERVRAVVFDRPDDLPARDASYYQRAAIILGWLDEAGAPTPAGEAAGRARDEDALAYALVAFESCPLGRRWLAHTGVEAPRLLDPDSAADFLRTVTDLSDSTVERRAGTLRHWLETLRSVDESPGSLIHDLRGASSGKVAAFLASQVEAHVPTRMANWCARNGVARFRDLVARDPESLLAERNLGRTSLRETRTVIREATGFEWELLRELSGLAPRVDPTTAESSTDPHARRAWDDLAVAAPDWLLQTAVQRLELPTRMVNFCAREGISTVAELLARREADLKAAANLGRKTLQQTRERIIAKVGSGTDVGPPPTPSLDDHDDLLTLFKSRVAALRPVERLVVTRRAGLHGDVPTLHELGTTMGVSRERIRQLETRGLQRLSSEWWVAPLTERLRAAVHTGARPLAEVAEADRFFVELDDHPVTVDFILERVLGGALRVVDLEGETLIAAGNPSAVFRALADGLAAAKSLPFPLPVDRVLDVMRHHARRVTGGLAPYFVDVVCAQLVLADDAGQSLVTGVGNTRKNRVLAYLEEHPEPIPLDALFAAIGGRCPLPPEVIYTARGWVTLPKHVPDFDLWASRLVPLCVAVMHTDPGRQWSVIELLDEIAEQAQVPEWLGHWHLAGMLRFSGKVRYLGRLQVALDREEAPQERLMIRELFLRSLREAGAPLPADELMEALLKERGGTVVALRLTLLGPPFAQVDDDRIGLVDRDVEGGVDAMTLAEQALEEELEELQHGMSPAESLAFVRSLSDAHAEWSHGLVRTAARRSDALRLNRSGGVGLADWDDARVPTRRGLVAAALEEGGGRVPVDDLLARIEGEFGTPSNRNSLYNLATTLGAHLQADELIRDDLAVASIPPPSSEAPDPTTVAGVPAVAIPMLTELLRETPGDLAALRAAALAYPDELERAKATHPHVVPEEGHAAARAAVYLIDNLPDDEPSRRLVWAAVRYFVEADDGESDLAIGGLDDDMDVLDAVADHLGLPEARVRRPTPASILPPPALAVDEGLALFETLATPDADLASLRDQVADHVARFHVAAKRFELLPVDLAEELAGHLDALLAEAASLSEADRALVIGAARYFVSQDDAAPDLGGVLGLDDDVAIFNHAARQMGRADLVIDL